MPILLPEEDNNESDVEELKFQPTQADEEAFFLIYYMHLQPSEIAAMSDDKRKWLLGSFMGQKQMEREMMMQNRIAQGLDLSNLKI